MIIQGCCNKQDAVMHRLLNDTIASNIDKQSLYINMKQEIEDMVSVVLVKYTTANTGTIPASTTNLSEKIEQSGINQSQISEIGKLFNNFIVWI